MTSHAVPNVIEECRMQNNLSFGVGMHSMQTTCSLTLLWPSNTYGSKRVGFRVSMQQICITGQSLFLCWECAHSVLLAQGPSCCRQFSSILQSGSQWDQLPAPGTFWNLQRGISGRQEGVNIREISKDERTRLYEVLYTWIFFFFLQGVIMKINS